MSALWSEFWAMSHRRKAWWIVFIALTMDAASGYTFSVAQHIPVWHGMYIALADAVTFGGDLAPSTPLGYAACTVICAMVIPLFGAALSLITTWLTSTTVHDHVLATEENIRSHVESQMEAHHEILKGHIARLHAHVETATGVAPPAPVAPGHANSGE